VKPGVSRGTVILKIQPFIAGEIHESPLQFLPDNYYFQSMDESLTLRWKMLAPAVKDKAFVYRGLLMRWNRKINLVSRTGNFPFNHEFLDSLFPLLAGLLPEGATVADLGSGGGFPVIPLSLSGSSRRFYAVESNSKKAVFLREAKRTLALDNLEVVQERVEGKLPGAVQFVTCKKSIAPDQDIFYNLFKHNELRSVLYYAGGTEEKMVNLKTLKSIRHAYFVESADQVRYLFAVTSGERPGQNQAGD
jgi:16S rRNA (guanine(527)-N(7))-methyltransferase RsmG